MKRILELVKWDSCGIGEAESFAEKAAFHNEFVPLEGGLINDLFKLKNIPLKAIDNQDYYVYYNYHSSSGYKTILYVNDEGQISFKVEKPQGGVLCAFFAEIIVFALTDRW